jgi:hypothetical protein
VTKDISLNSNYKNANTSGDISIGSDSYRTPTDAEFWSVFQKWFAFEEPSNKWSQIRKALKKLIHRGSDKVADSLSLQQQGVLFSHIFSSSNIKSNTESDERIAEKLLSLALAAEDIKRFNRLSFDSWLNSASASTTACAIGGGQQSDSQAESNGEEPLTISISGYSTGFDISIARDAVLTQSELLWLENSINASPGWSMLKNDGPWTGDSRAELMKEFLDEITVALKQFSITDHVIRDPQSSINDHGNLAPQSTATQSKFPQQIVDQALNTWSKLVEKWRVSPTASTALPGAFLPSVLLLVEGQTECILLPAMSKLLGTSLDTIAVDITDCGGAKQVVKHYLNLREVTVLPIVCVLDSDVEEPAEIISDSLRPSDRLITTSRKEIEDTFSQATFLRLLNIYMSHKAEHYTSSPLTLSELKEMEQEETGRTAVLDRLMRARGMGSFDKIGFARVAAEKLQANEIPQDGKKIVKTLLEIHNDGISFRYQSK